MTRAFDLQAVAKPGLFDSVTIKTVPAAIRVEQVPVKEVRRAIVTGHYSGVMPDAVQECFGAYADGVLVGAAAYGPGGNSKTLAAIIPGFDNTNGRELIRVWAHQDAPTNTVSRMVAASLKMLPRPVGLVVTFADSGQGHVGTIYQALNFYYLGMSSKGVRYVDRDGVEVTARLANIYRMRNPARFGKMSLGQIREELGWQPVVSHPKHRYAIGVGISKRKVNRTLAGMALPYPRRELP